MTVNARQDESIESLIKRFNKEVNGGGILKEIRLKRWFISKGEQKRMERKRGIRRAKQQQRRLERSFDRER